MQLLKEFSNRALTQIKWWAWAATVLPMTGLSCMFFIWTFGTDHWIDIAMTVGATIMFTIAVVWWWWVIWVVSRIIKRDKAVAKELCQTVNEIKDVKVLIRENLVARDK